MSKIGKKGAKKTDRSILHCDLNGFYASVECLDNPALRTVPLAVAGDPENRAGIILAKNELAKKFGVETAETVWRAKKKCPNLVLTPPRHARYMEMSKMVNRLYGEYTDQVEPFGIDESFLDVTGSLSLFHASPKELADTIRSRVRDQLGLTISVGVSFNKAFAKLGSDMKKPDATTVIGRENFKTLIWPLPASALLYVGKTTKETLEKHMIKTIGDLAQSDLHGLSRWLGKGGETLWKYANGLDDERVRGIGEADELKSVGNGMTFKRDLVGEDEIRQGILALTDEVATRMRRHGVKCKTVQVHIKDPNLKTISRQITLGGATYLQKDLVDCAMKLILKNWPANAPIRALTVTAASLVGAEESFTQTSLFDEPDNKGRARREKLEDAVYRIRIKHGENSIAMGRAGNAELGIPGRGPKEK